MTGIKATGGWCDVAVTAAAEAALGRQGGGGGGCDVCDVDTVCSAEAANGEVGGKWFATTGIQHCCPRDGDSAEILKKGINDIHKDAT